jgi:hypothetical protein
MQKLKLRPIQDKAAAENNAGNGIGIGDDDMTLEEAVEAEGWTLIES